MIDALRALLRNRKGATAVEYGFIAALVVIAMIAALQGVADTTTGMWNDVAGQVTEASASQ